ncbi:MAG: hypothetical protein RSD99_21705 [Janthinobacterium sp.]
MDPAASHALIFYVQHVGHITAAVMREGVEIVVAQEDATFDGLRRAHAFVEQVGGAAFIFDAALCLPSFFTYGTPGPVTLKLYAGMDRFSLSMCTLQA